MLVLSRKEGESVVIGEAVVTVVKTSGGRVSLGVAAPREIAIHRLECVRKMEPESTAAAG